MDPFEILNQDNFPYIFQHFSVREILKMSKVSSKWNNVISNSYDCMDKIWLRFYDPVEDVKVLMRSKRKYRNFKVQRKMKPKVEKVFQKFNWKGAMLRDCDSRDSIDEHLKLVTKIAPSVEELEWWNISPVETFHSFLPPIDFPMLRKLECFLLPNSVEMLRIFLGKNPRLKHVSFSKWNVVENPDFELLHKISLQFLKQNSQIKHLTLNDIDTIFQNDISSEVDFNLESLSVTTSASGQEKTNFIKFIRSQTKLQKVSVQIQNYIQDWELFTEIWGAMRCCKTFEFLHSLNMQDLENLQIQPSITSLRVANSIMGLLSATPNLESLQTGQINEHIMTFAAHNLRSLKVIKFIVAGGQIENYERMKRNHFDINKDILLQQQTLTDFNRD